MAMSKPEIKDAVENMLEDFPMYRTARFTHELEKMIKMIDSIDILSSEPVFLFIEGIKKHLQNFYLRNDQKFKHARWKSIEDINTPLQCNLLTIDSGHAVMNEGFNPDFINLDLKLRLAVNLSDSLAVHYGNYTINGIPFPESFFKRLIGYLEDKSPNIHYFTYLPSDLT